jgi:hypothetical protein
LQPFSGPARTQIERFNSLQQRRVARTLDVFAVFGAVASVSGVAAFFFSTDIEGGLDWRIITAIGALAVTYSLSSHARYSAIVGAGSRLSQQQSVLSLHYVCCFGKKGSATPSPDDRFGAEQPPRRDVGIAERFMRQTATVWTPRIGVERRRRSGTTSATPPSPATRRRLTHRRPGLAREDKFRALGGKTGVEPEPGQRHEARL